MKTALLPLLTQHTQLGHSHSQHPERATAMGEMPAQEQHPRAWARRTAQRMLPNLALLETSPKQELTPMYTVASLCRDVFASKGKSRELGSRSLSLWHPSEVESGVNVKLWGHKKGLLVCLILGGPTRFATTPSYLPREHVLSPLAPAAAVLQQTPSFHFPVQPPTSPGSCLKFAHGCCDEEQVFDQSMITSLQ